MTVTFAMNGRETGGNQTPASNTFIFNVSRVDDGRIEGFKNFVSVIVDVANVLPPRAHGLRDRRAARDQSPPACWRVHALGAASRLRAGAEEHVAALRPTANGAASILRDEEMPERLAIILRVNKHHRAVRMKRRINSN